MRDYTYLTMRDRCLITTFLSMNAPVSTIAARSGRHRATTSRDLKKNRQKPEDRYMPGIAHQVELPIF